MEKKLEWRVGAAVKTRQGKAIQKMEIEIHKKMHGNNLRATLRARFS